MKNKKPAKADQKEITKLAAELQKEAQTLEETHPQLVAMINALCLLLSRLGI